MSAVASLRLGLDTKGVPPPHQDLLPFAWSRGWPRPIADGVVTFSETGIALGSLPLSEEEWRTLRGMGVLSLRVDDHAATDGWTTRQPDGTESTVEFTIPVTAVRVPLQALAHESAFSEWVMDNHGASGRLLLWDASEGWWMLQEPDLELLVTCAPQGMFSKESALPVLHPNDVLGPREIHALAVHYGVA